MNWRRLIEHSGLSTQQQHLILSGECSAIRIDDKLHEINLIIRLNKEKRKKLGESEFKVTSMGCFKEGRKDEKAFMCRLFINVEEE